MTDPTKDFFDLIVEPAIDEYLDAECALTAAEGAGDPAGLEAARALALRRARTAAIELHQFADRVMINGPAWAPPGTIKQLRDWLRTNQGRQINGQPVEDFHLLLDVANAFKHAQLTHTRDRAWLVQDDKVVVSSATGFGELGWGEGKWGGAQAIIIEKTDGKKRAMSLMLSTVRDAWRSAMSTGAGGAGA